MRMRMILDYFVATPRYASQNNVCTQCGREIGAYEICLTDGYELMCVECINDWIGRPQKKHASKGLVEFLEKLGCDACECPDEEEYSREQEYREQTEYMFRER